MYFLSRTVFIIPLKKFTFYTLLVYSVLSLSASPLWASKSKSPLPTPADVDSRPVLRIGVGHAFPPYQFEKDDHVEGFDVDLVTAVAKAAGYRVSLQTDVWDSIVTRLDDGRLDLIGGMAKLPSRTDKYAFTVPVCYVTYSAFTKSESRIKDIDDLLDRTIAMQRGSAGEAYYEHRMRNGTIRFVNDDAQALKLLEEGKVDAAVLPKMQGMYTLHEKQWKDIKALPHTIVVLSQSFATRKGNEELIYNLNESLNTLKEDGVYQTIYNKWFSIYENKIPEKVFKYILIALVVLFALLLVSIFLIYIFRKLVDQRTRELQNNRQLLRDLIDSVPMLISIIDKDGKYRIINEQYSMFFDKSLDEFEGHHISDVLPQGLAERQQKRMSECLKGKTIEFNEEIKFEGNNSKHVYGIFKPFYDTNGKIDGLTSTIIDTTERQLVEKKLKESELRYRSLYESMSELFALHEMVYDAEGHPIDYRIIDCNPAFSEFTGIPREEAIDKSARGLFGNASEDLIPVFNQVALTGVPAHLEFDDKLNNENKRLALSVFSPKKGTFAVVANDITERVRAENRLLEEKELLATTVRSIGDAVIVCDVASRIILFNKVAEQLTAWPIPDALGRSLPEVFRIIRQQTREENENLVTRVLRSGKFINLDDTTVLVAHDGHEYNIEANGTPIYDREGQITGVVLVFRDTTDKKNQEQARIRTQKLESLALLAGGIAHDFNNLLTGILGNVTLAHMESGLSETLDELLAEAERASIRAKGLTQQLLTFSRGGDPVKKVSDLTDLICDTALFSTRGSSAKCKFQIDPELHAASVDTGQIGQVIQNLVINAVESMPNGGIITVHADNVTLEAGNQLGMAAGEYVKIRISDQGSGIPSSQLDRIFDPYYSTKQHGNGLGLSVCHSIITRHNGKITVSSTQGQGAEFSLYLPATARSASNVKMDHGPFTANSGKILLMDDEEIIRRMAVMMLAKLGFEAITVADGPSAIRAYREAMDTDKPFTLVILDLTLPGGMGGQETFLELQKIDPEIKAIVSSGYSNDSVMASFDEIGFAGILAKPYRMDELREVLASVLQKKSVKSN